jgi:hypothetical protein
MGKCIKWILVFGILSLNTVMMGQIFSRHYSVPTVKKGKVDRLMIKTPLDLFEIKKTPEYFSHVTSVCVDGKVDINKVLQVLYELNELYEVKFRNYSGNMRLMKGDTLELIEDAVFYMTYENMEDLKVLNEFPKLRTLTLVHPGPVVEEWPVIRYLAKVKRLNVLGDFLPQDIDSLSGYLSELKQLEHLGLGLDYITDLKKYVKYLPNLKSLSIFDNASHVENIEFIDYPMDKRMIQYSEKGKKKEILFRFYSDRFTIEPYDLHYLKTIFEGALFDKGNTEDKSVHETFVINNWSELSVDTGAKLDYTAFAHPAANIPISYLSPYVEYFKINTLNNAIIHTQNGTELLIPALSIVDKYGKIIKGEVMIAFADLSHPINIFLAGLNMKTRRKGKDIQLNPLQMFEVKAFLNGEPLNMAKGKSMKATFMVPRDSVFSQYVLDPGKRTWRPTTGYYYKMKLEQLKKANFGNWLRDTSTQMVYGFDNTGFTGRYANPEYYYLMGKMGMKNNFEKRKGMRYHTYPTLYHYSEDKNSISVKKGKKLIRISKVPREEGEKKEMIKFQLVDVSGWKLFPELRVFAKYQFCVNFPKGRREFSKQYTVKKRYFDLRVFYNKRENKGYVELKGAEGYVKLPFNIHPEEEEKFIKMHKKYLSLLHLRELEYNGILGDKEKKFIKNYHANRKKENHDEKSLVLADFGIYSTSVESKMERKKELIASFTTRHGIPLDLRACYIIHDNTKTVYTFYNKNIYFDANHVKAIICVDHKGDVYFIEGDRLRYMKLAEYSYSVIKLDKIENQLKTSDDFSMHIGVN